MSRHLIEPYRLACTVLRLFFLVCCLCLSFLSSNSFSETNSDGKSFKLALIVPNAEPSFWLRAIEFTEEAARDLGMQLSVYSAEGIAEQMVNNTQEAIQSGTDGIIFKDFEDTGEKILGLAEQAGIPAININSPLLNRDFSPRTRYQQWIGSVLPDDSAVGETLIRNLLEKARRRNIEQYNILLLNGNRNDQPAIDRRVGFERIARYLPNVKTLDLYPDWEKDKAKTQFLEAYQNDPSINIVWSASDHMVLGVIEAIQELKLEKPPLIGSVDWHRNILESVEKGQVDFSIGGHFLDGAWAVVLMYDYLNGADFLKQRLVFNSSMVAVEKATLDQYRPYFELRPGSIDFASFSLVKNPFLNAYAFDPRRVVNPASLGPQPYESASLVLTDQEKEWLRAHPVWKVSSEPDFAPYDFRINEQPVGYSIDLIKLIAARLDVKLEFVKDDWTALLEGSKTGRVDVLHSLVKEPKEREAFLHFTNPYKSSTAAIVMQEDEPAMQSPNELIGRRVAIVKGDANAGTLPERYPGMKMVEVSDYEAALKAVALDEADATILELPVANYLIRDLLLNNLKVASSLEVDNAFERSYHFAVRKDWPELAPILNKALASLEYDTTKALDERWLESRPSIASASYQNGYYSGLTSNELLFIAVFVLVVIAVAFVFFRLFARSSSDTTFELSSARGRRLLVFSNGCFVVIAFVLALWALSAIKDKVKEDAGTFLETILQSTTEAMVRWVQEQKASLESVAQDPAIVELVGVTRLLHNAGRQIEEYPLDALNSQIARLSLRDSLGYSIVAPDGSVIASDQLERVGKASLISSQMPSLLARALSGESVMAPPVFDRLSIANGQASLVPQMFFIVPVRSISGDVIAAFVQRLDPSAEFSRINLLGRVGDTGETYSFDRRANQLSLSRFSNQMAAAGMLDAGQGNILTIQVRDPGANLIQGETSSLPVSQRPLTWMANEAVAGRSGINTDGYRDYRGVTVIGAWAWLKDLNIGMATEIEAREAFASYETARVAIVTIMLITALVSIAFTLFIMILASRSQRALKLAAETLESSVALRTRELSDSQLETRKALSDLSHNERRYRSLVTNIPGVVFRCDPDENWTMHFISQYVEELTGYPPSDFVANAVRSFDSIIHPEDQERVRTVINEAIEGEGFYTIEYRIIASCGDVRHFYEKGQVMRRTNGEVDCLDGFIYDNTKRKKAELALETALDDLTKAEARMEMVLEAAKLGQWEFHIDTLDVLSTEGTERMYGYKEGELLEPTGSKWRPFPGGVMGLESYHHPEDFQRYLSASKALASKRSPLMREEYRFKHADDRWHWKQSVARVVEWDDNGDPKTIYGILVDIDELKSLQIELIDARDKAEAGSRAKSEFLASMSHEIRTPMNGVLGMLELLVQDKLSPEQSRRISVAKTSAQSLLSIINDILDFSKVEAGKLTLDKVDFDIQSLFGEVLQALALKSEEKSLELALDLSGVGLKVVRGDPIRLRQILTNLVSNAIKFTEDGEVVVRANLTELDEKSLYLSCEIRDTGIGIEPNQMENLFDAFTQADSSTTRQYGGTGLGLAITKNLVELMGGEIDVESYIDEGSTFRFSILLERSKEVVFSVPTIDFSQLKLLVVDDSATNREIFRAQLTNWGAQVEEAADAQQAFEMCVQRSNGHRFDAVLVDMNMPEEDGISLAKRLSNTPHLSNMSLLLMTSALKHERHQEIREAGFSGVFSKPITPSDLFDAISVVSVHKENLHRDGTLVTETYLQAAQPIGLPGSESEWAKSTKVLLVEDNFVNQEVAEGMLHAMGIEFVSVPNGADAIAKLNGSASDKPYNLILMDCQMPVMDGYEATERIRAGEAGEQNTDIAIIAMTAHAMERDREKCLAAGMNDYLAKPFEFRALADLIERIVCMDTGNASDSAPLNEAGVTLVIPNGLKLIDFAREKPSIADIPEAFLKALRIFVNKSDRAREELLEAVEQGNNSVLRDKIHTLKGASGNLGMQDLYALSSQIEVDILESIPISNDISGELGRLIDEAVEDAKAILESNADTDSSAETRPYQEIARHLLVLIEDSALVPAELLAEYARSSKGIGNQDTRLLIISALENFDYEEAKRLLLLEDKR